MQMMIVQHNQNEILLARWYYLKKNKNYGYTVLSVHLTVENAKFMRQYWYHLEISYSSSSDLDKLEKKKPIFFMLEIRPVE